MYQLIENVDSPNFTTSKDWKALTGYERNILNITIHHWGGFGQKIENVVKELSTAGTRKSAHFVVQEGIVYCIVSPSMVAWHSGNPYGNAVSIGIECRPEATDGDYKTVAELVRFLRGIYGPVLPLVGHRYWVATECPGVWDLNRIEKTIQALPVSNPTPPKEEHKVATLWDESIQEYAQDGRTPTVKKPARFIFGQLNQWFTRVLDAQADTNAKLDAIMKHLGITL